MKKFCHYLYNKFVHTHNGTEIKLTFDQETSHPNITLSLANLDDKTAEELAKIFYVCQSGAIQQVLIDKIATISAEHNVLFLDNVYNKFNALVVTSGSTKSNNLRDHDEPLIKPLEVFNIHASNH